MSELPTSILCCDVESECPEHVPKLAFRKEGTISIKLTLRRFVDKENMQERSVPAEGLPDSSTLRSV
jgi:hypothetical protein